MSKRIVKMNESVLRSLIKESISRVISEMDEGKYSNNKPFFHGGIRDVKPGEKAFKHTNPDKDEDALEKHNARLDKHLPDMMDSDKLKAREAQIKSSKRGGMPRENFKDTLEGKLKKNKQEYKQVSESDLHRIVKESVQKIIKEGDNLTQETYQVNISDTVDGKSTAWVSRYSPDGYVGRLTDTVYSDGSDSTDWCVFTGTKEECDNHATEYNNKGSE